MIRAYNASTDEETLLSLWSAVFGDKWPLDAALLRREAIDVPTYLPGDYLLALVDGQVVGFALTQTSQGAPPRGSLLALGVHPLHHRRLSAALTSYVAWTTIIPPPGYGSG